MFTVSEKRNVLFFDYNAPVSWLIFYNFYTIDTEIFFKGDAKIYHFTLIVCPHNLIKLQQQKLPTTFCSVLKFHRKPYSVRFSLILSQFVRKFFSQSFDRKSTSFTCSQIFQYFIFKLNIRNLNMQFREVNFHDVWCYDVIDLLTKLVLIYHRVFIPVSNSKKYYFSKSTKKCERYKPK